MPRRQRVSPHHRGLTKTRFLVRTSKNFVQNKFALIYWPLYFWRGQGGLKGCKRGLGYTVRTAIRVTSRHVKGHVKGYVKGHLKGHAKGRLKGSCT